jgi:uncharacterized protein
VTIAADLLQRHIETLLNPDEWETLIADDILWELPFAPALGHPARLEGREAVEKHVNWFRGAVENFHFSDIRVYPLADPNGAAAEARAEGRIRASGREYRQEYVFFLRAAGGKIAFLREYFDPTRAAKRWISIPSDLPARRSVNFPKFQTESPPGYAGAAPTG